MMRASHLTLLWLGLILLACVSARGAEVDFRRDIQPIFNHHCAECHGEKKAKAGLRFDRKATVFKGGDSGQPAVFPGKSADSLLIKKITSHDADEMMPPKGERLSGAQVNLLRQWIDSGAVWPDDGPAEKPHWAYVKPQRATLPPVSNAKWCRNPIDNFILAKLEQEKLKPGREAERATLLRRVSLDLTGLPPTLEEVDAFLADKSPEAYDRVVERLLASPAYGERWARPWLDLARYADTQGFEKDSRRTIWPYRDWVISALNRNLPFDQFTIEQLAGDLLPDATRDQKVATGFHRNTMTNTEGGTDNEEFRYEALVDRVNTTFAVWMGSTMGCAQCHNHKYDPFATVEYYRAMAFLNSTEDADYDDERPTMKVFAAGQQKQLDALRATGQQADEKLRKATNAPAFVESMKNWLASLSASNTAWETLDLESFRSLGGATLTKTGSKSILADGPNPTNDTYIVTAKVPAGANYRGVRLEVLETGEEKALGRHENGGFVLSKFDLSVQSPGGETRQAKWKSVSADYSQKKFDAANLLTGQGDGWAVATLEKGNRVRRSAYFTPSEPLEFPAGGTLAFTFQHSDRHPGANLRRFRIYVTRDDHFGPPPELPEDVRAILATAGDKRDAKQQARLAEYHRSIDPATKPLHDAHAAAKKEADDFDKSIPSTSVMRELEQPRETKRHVRGAYLTTAESVTPGTPAFLHAFRPELPTNRLGFARWLVDTDNPLTARVMVNRIWEQYFGRGLVETVEEFGKQGDPPTHPELLDWLACEFMVAWDLKHLHRLIVSSAAYRQSSAVTPQLLQRDPFNRFLARGPRVRLEAEMVRDQMLAVSGLLSKKLGGPSVMPPQPDGLWQVVYSGDQWTTSSGEDRYRRGLYTFWRRSNPHPMMVNFDAPSREFCVLKRSRSNTPLQALNTLNDPAAIECAQAIARRVAARPDAGLKSRATYAFRLVLSRKPQTGEVERLVSLYKTELKHYAADEKDAGKMAASELGLPKLPANLAELAAWTVVANVLLNLDEAITKG